MGLAGKKLTDPEKAAIYFHVFSGCDDWKTIYKIAQQKYERKGQDPKYIDTYVSRWKTSEKIKAYTAEIQEKKSELLLKAKQAGILEEQEREAESERNENESQTKTAPTIDYSDPRRRKDLYNKIIRNAVDDPKTQLDAAKVLEQLQRDDRQAANEQKQVRAYLPIVCNDCPLYQKVKNRL